MHCNYGQLGKRKYSTEMHLGSSEVTPRPGKGSLEDFHRAVAREEEVCVNRSLGMELY